MPNPPRMCELKRLINIAHNNMSKKNLLNVWNYFERFNFGTLHYYVQINFQESYQIRVLWEACDTYYDDLGFDRRTDYYWDYYGDTPGQ